LEISNFGTMEIGIEITAGVCGKLRVIGDLGGFRHHQGARVKGRLHSGSRGCGSAKIDRSADGSKQWKRGEREHWGYIRLAVL
jgi:hypothetical protein